MSLSYNNLSYTQRADLTEHPLTQYLLQLLDKKQTNLALSADVTRKAELLALADELGPHICILKTHIDIIEDFDRDLINRLTALAKKHQFLIFEDRKFADIGNTVRLQFQAGIYHIAEWANLITVHSLPGAGIINGLKAANAANCGFLLLAEMSSADNLLDNNYTERTIKMAQENPDSVVGFIAQHKLIDDPRFVYLTPGVSLETNNDNLGQRYLHPTHVIAEKSSDIIIVGRAIYKANSPVEMAQIFRELAWQAYLNRRIKD